MTQSVPHVSLVVPVHHCEGSLDRFFRELEQFLDEAHMRTEVIIVDDRGSHPEASEMLACFASGRSDVRVIQNDRNRGKGYSVVRGMLEASGSYRVFTDADVAYPLHEVWKVVARLQNGADVAIACRVHPESQYTMSAQYLRYIYTRHVMSRVFNRFVRLTLIPGVLDTQAGLKGYTAEASREVFSRVRIAGFGFDLECLYVATRMRMRIDQVPVHFRYNDEPTTVKFARDVRTMAADVARIRWRGWTGGYGAASVIESRPGVAIPTSARVPGALPLASQAAERSSLS